MLSELKQNISLASIVNAAGIELRHNGNRYVGLCPFHADKTPSFFVFPNNRFKCFGCGEHGDVINFVQKFYNLSFKDALKHLGIEQGRITPEVRWDIQERKRKAERVKKYKDWLSHYTAHIGSLIIETKDLMKNITLEDLDLYASLFHMLPIWGYHLSILVEGSDEERFELYKLSTKPCGNIDLAIMEKR